MKRLDVVAAIIVEGNRYLATQRGYGEFKDGWEFPGGKVKRGESHEQALVREIEEELACRIAVDRHVLTVECDYPDFHLSLHGYLCHVVQGKIKLVEAEAACWLTKTDLLSVEWLPADRSIAEALLGEG